MANKIGEWERNRIKQLLAIPLTHNVIAQRLGVCDRTIRIYVRALREGSVPYHPDRKVDAPQEP